MCGWMCGWKSCLRWKVRPIWSLLVLFGPHLKEHPLRAYDFLRGLRRSHFHCGSGTFDFLVVLVRPKENQRVLKICNGKCNGINLACNGKINV